jgi:hypothetical protein
MVGMFGSDVRTLLIPSIFNEYQVTFHFGEITTNFVRL